MHFGELSSRDSDNNLPGGAYESRFFVILCGARGLPVELFAVKLRCSPCRRLVSEEDLSYVDFRSSLCDQVMSRRFNSLCKG